MTYASYLAADTAVILLFHGVIERQINPVRNYTRKHLEKETFVSILRSMLSASGRPISLDRWIEHHVDGRPLPPRSFAVTFDDGFRNNLTIAAPVLVDLGISATFYVTSDFIARNRMSWIDRIEYALETAPAGGIELPWGSRRFRGDEEKRSLLDEIRQNAKADPHCDFDGLADAVQSQLGLDLVTSTEDVLDRKMTWEEVRTLSTEPSFQVGGHSHTHSILSFLDDPALEREVATSLEMLAEKAGIGSRHYSYPEGLAHCYSDRVIACLRAHGVACCPTAEPGVNDHRTSLFHLKRIPVI